MRQAKRPKATRAAQVELVARMQASGMSVAAIKKYADEHEWGVGKETIRKYTKVAQKRTMAIMNERTESKLGTQMAKLQRIHQKAMAEGNLSVALRAVAEQNDLLGIGNENKLLIEHSGGVDHKHAHALFAQIDSYTDEFRLAAKAEAIEALSTAVTRGDRVAAGLPVEKEPKWEDKPVILPDGTECVPCEDDTDEALEDDDREEDAMVREMHPLEREASPIYSN